MDFTKIKEIDLINAVDIAVELQKYAHIVKNMTAEEKRNIIENRIGKETLLKYENYHEKNRYKINAVIEYLEEGAKKYGVGI